MKNIKVYIIIFVLLLSAKLFAQVNPSLNYYPLHIGDFWQYRVTKNPSLGSDSVWIGFKTVLKDTILENYKRYYIVNERFFDNYDRIRFIRIDSLSGNVYERFPSLWVGKLDSLYADSGQVLNCYNIVSVTEKVILGLNTKARLVNMTCTSSTAYNGWELAYYLGEIMRYYDDIFITWIHYQADIVYAKINGVEYGQLVDVKEEKNYMPQEFSLSQNFPNPFNPSTTIKFSIPAVGTQHAVSLQLKVYDLLGREIATLVNEEKAPGNYEVTFNGESRLGESLPSGVYFYRLQARNYSLGAEQGFSATKKMIYLK